MRLRVSEFLKLVWRMDGWAHQPPSRWTIREAWFTSGVIADALQETPLSRSVQKRLVAQGVLGRSKETPPIPTRVVRVDETSGERRVIGAVVYGKDGAYVQLAPPEAPPRTSDVADLQQRLTEALASVDYYKELLADAGEDYYRERRRADAAEASLTTLLAAIEQVEGEIHALATSSNCSDWVTSDKLYQIVDTLQARRSSQETR